MATEKILVVDDDTNICELLRLYLEKDGFKIIPIVSMASLTRLKENGVFVDKWMAFFHNPDFVNFKTIPNL